MIDSNNDNDDLLFTYNAKEMLIWVKVNHKADPNVTMSLTLYDKIKTVAVVYRALLKTLLNTLSQ